MTDENYMKKLADMQTQIKELVPDSLKENGERRMSDLISRQVAIEAAMQDVSDKRPHDFNAGATRAANRIKLLPTIDVIPIEWILLYIQEYPYMTASSMLHYWSVDQALERKAIERKKGKKNE